MKIGRSLKPLRRPLLWSGLWICAVATVVVLSLIPVYDLPNLPPSGDKAEHFLAYFALSAGAVQLYERWPALLGAGIGLVFLGIGLEHAQGALTATRVMDRGDALANTFGVIAGLATQLTPWRDALLHWEARKSRRAG